MTTSRAVTISFLLHDRWQPGAARATVATDDATTGNRAYGVSKPLVLGDKDMTWYDTRMTVSNFLLCPNIDFVVISLSTHRKSITATEISKTCQTWSEIHIWTNISRSNGAVAGP